MDSINLVLLFFLGIVAGGINSVAGGGSLFTLPMLMFMGLPPSVANATNRLAIFTQGATSALGFRSKGIHVFKKAIPISISAILGALAGSYITTTLSDEAFKKIIVIIMILVAFSLLLPSTRKAVTHEEISRPLITYMMFFFIGVYGGFIQAGVGFIIIAVLHRFNGLSIHVTNALKVIIVFIYTFFVLIYFIWADLINWPMGITLAVGNGIGGWLAARWSVRVNQKWIRWFIVSMVIVMAINLWFF